MPGFEWDLAEVIQDSDCPKSTSKNERRRLLGCANKSLLQEKTTFSSATAVTQRRASVKPQSKLNPLALDRRRPDGNPKQGMGNGSLNPEMNGSGSRGEGDPPQPRVLFPKENLQLDWKYCKIWDVRGQPMPVRRPGAGLHNPNVLCYINAAINCLTYTAPLTNYLLSFDHRNSCKAASEDNKGGVFKGPRRDKGFGHFHHDVKTSKVNANADNACSMCLMTSHVIDCFKSHGKVIRPVLHSHLKKVCPNFKGDNQEDAQEYMSYLLNSMDADYLRLHGTVDQETAMTSVINQIFSGCQQTEVECRTCHYKSASTMIIRELTLDIKTVFTLESALEKHFTREILKEDNAYKCERCKAIREASKTDTMKEPPVVLSFMLKRFQGEFNKMAKINRNIRIEEEIDIRRHMSQKKGGPVMYKLYAMMVHDGQSLNCGHYYAYCKGPDNKWYLFNDSSVSEVPVENVLANGQAYILLYQRKTIAINGPASAKEAHNNHLNHQTKVKVINGYHVDPMKHGASTNGKKKNLLSGVKTKPQFGEMNSRLPVVSQASTSKSTPLPEKRDKISFGMRDTSGRPPTASQPSTSKSTPLPEKREKVSFGMRPSVILQINHGMDAPADKAARATSGSRTMERCPDGQLVLSKMPSKSGLVPYEEDSESDVENGRTNGPVPKRNGSPLPSSSSSSSHPPASNSSSRPPMKDGVLDATTSVPGNSNLRTWEGVRAFSPVSHTRQASAPVKRSQSCERILSRFQPKTKGTGSAGSSPCKDHSYSLPVCCSPDFLRKDLTAEKRSVHITSSHQTVDPGLGSPSTSKPVADSGLNGKRVVSTHCGWLVKKEALERDASADAEVAGCNGGHILNGSEQGGGDSQGTKPLHRHSNMPSAGGDDRARVPNGPSMRMEFSHGEAGASTPNGHVDRECRTVTPDSHRSNHHLRDSHIPSASHRSLPSPWSPVDVSDRRPLLEDSESSSPAKSKKHKKHKKHKKRRYQEDEEEEFSESRLGHKKHKKKKHKHKEHRDRGEVGHHHTLHNGTDHLSDSSHRGGKKSTASSESEEYEWVERTKDSIASAQPQVDQKDESAPTQRSRCPPLTETRKSAKEESLGVMEELERNHSLAYGKPVYSWDGNLSSLSQDREQPASRKRTWEEDYEDELDRAKMKKYKKHNEKSHHQRSSNPFQRALDERVRVDKPHHSGSHRPTSFSSNMDDSRLHESHKPNSHSSHSSSSYRPGYPSNGSDGHRASSHPSDRHSVSGMSSNTFYGRSGSNAGFLPWRKAK